MLVAPKGRSNQAQANGLGKENRSTFSSGALKGRPAGFGASTPLQGREISGNDQQALPTSSPTGLAGTRNPL